MKAHELETKLTEKFGMKRFTKQELNEYLNNHFWLKGTKKTKLHKVENPDKKIFDDAFIFTVPYDNLEYDITMYYLKTNSNQYFVLEFFVELV